MNDLFGKMLGVAGAVRMPLTRRLGVAGAVGMPVPRRLIPAPPSDPPRLENADVAVTLDQRPNRDQGGDDVHVVVENCGRAPARNIDVALLPVREVDQVHLQVERRPKHRIRLDTLEQGERQAVRVATLPGPIVAATCRWSDGFADYERHRLLKLM